MAQRTLDAERLESTSVVKEPGHSNDRVQLQQSRGGCRVIEVYLARLDLRCKLRWDRLGINLETEGEGRLGADTSTHAAQLLSCQ